MSAIPYCVGLCRTSTDQDKRYEVQSVARAAVLLDLVGNAGAGGLGVTEIAGHLGVAKSTALSLARTLSAAGLLRAVDPGPRYVLGLNLLRLGRPRRSTDVDRRARATDAARSLECDRTDRATGDERERLSRVLRANRRRGVDPIPRAARSTRRAARDRRRQGDPRRDE